MNGVVFEPFAGSCHGGVSNWIAQPSFRTDLYVRELVLTGDDLGSWPGYPFYTSRTGTFLTGTRSVGFWCVLGNGDSLRKISLRYLRPDNSVALAPTPYTTNSFFRNGTFDFSYTFNLNVTGLWHLEISVNDQVVANAPFTVISSGSPVNPARRAACRPYSIQPRLLRMTCSLPDHFIHYHARSGLRFAALPLSLASQWRHGARCHQRRPGRCHSAQQREPGRYSYLHGHTYGWTLNGPATAVSASVAAPASVSDHLLNISTRLPVQTGDNVLIGGMIATGSESKKVIVRAIGPSLAGAGVQGFLADPTLELHDSSGGVIATNDDCGNRARKRRRFRTPG